MDLFFGPNDEYDISDEEIIEVVEAIEYGGDYSDLDEIDEIVCLEDI